VNVQFDWWLLIVGFVLGAGMTGLVLAELRRREDDVTARERGAEAAWIASDLTAHGIPADAEAVGEVLRLHRLYLASLPADEPELDELDEIDAEVDQPVQATSPAVQPDAAGSERDGGGPPHEGGGPPYEGGGSTHEGGGPPVGQAPDAREDARTLS
jgi:hypothetical protein